MCIELGRCNEVAVLRVKQGERVAVWGKGVSQRLEFLHVAFVEYMVEVQQHVLLESAGGMGNRCRNGGGAGFRIHGAAAGAGVKVVAG